VGGVKVLVHPLQHLVAFRAVRRGEDFLEFGEAVNAAAVLRRAGAFTGEARRVSLAVLGDRAGLDDKLVFPAVAEIVFVPIRVLTLATPARRAFVSSAYPSSSCGSGP
jgi:hypothetical protein